MFSDKDWIVRGTVDAASDDVFDAIVTARRGEMRALGDGYEDAVSVETGSRSVSVKGHWWYHGITVVTEDPRGSVVTYQVKNVGGPLAYLDKPFYRKRMQRDLDALLADVCRRLQCSFMPEP
jgi:hypothetical protein